MDRKLYKSSFTEHSPPSWKCPTCGSGNLRVKKDSFKYWETSNSKKAHDHPEFDFDFIEHVYSCVFECTDGACNEEVANSGKGYVGIEYDHDPDGYPTQDYYNYFLPKFFNPYLKLFAIPEDVPNEVVKEIHESFELFFCNPSSSLNHLRIALENLLTHLKVNRTEMVDGRRAFMSLHKRIKLIPEKFKAIKEHCLAIKWAGNAGSHGSKEITIDDVMDAYEIMDEVLREIFKNEKEGVKKLVKEINKKKGPKGKSRQKRKRAKK